VFLSAVDDRAWEERVAKANTVASVQVLTHGDRKVSAVCVHIARALRRQIGDVDAEVALALQVSGMELRAAKEFDDDSTLGEISQDDLKHID